MSAKMSALDRRQILALAFTPRESLPTAIKDLNTFAEAYNSYVWDLQRGIIDRRKWLKIKELWLKLQ